MQNIDLTVVGTILTIITGFVLNFQKNKMDRAKQMEAAKVDNEKILNKLSDVDLQQNERQAKFEEKFELHIQDGVKDREKLDQIFELTKHQRFFGQLSSALTMRVYKLTKSQNLEIADMLFRSVQAVKPYFEEILKSDFNGINEEIVTLEIKGRIKNVRNSINKTNLELSEIQKELLIKTLSTELKPAIEKFSFDLNIVSKNKTNGERRKAFEELCIELIDKEIETTIRTYNEIKKSDK